VPGVGAAAMGLSLIMHAVNFAANGDEDSFWSFLIPGFALGVSRLSAIGRVGGAIIEYADDAGRMTVYVDDVSRLPSGVVDDLAPGQTYNGNPINPSWSLGQSNLITVRPMTQFTWVGNRRNFIRMLSQNRHIMTVDSEEQLAWFRQTLHYSDLSNSEDVEKLASIMNMSVPEMERFLFTDPTSGRRVSRTSAIARANLARLEGIYTNQPVEVSGIFDEDGNYLASWYGTTTITGNTRNNMQVSFSSGYDLERMQRAIRRSTLGTTFIHSHPSSLTFSDLDIRNALAGGFRQFMAVGESQTRILTIENIDEVKNALTGVTGAALDTELRKIRDVIVSHRDFPSVPSDEAFEEFFNANSSGFNVTFINNNVDTSVMVRVSFQLVPNNSRIIRMMR
jgi:hypothetical protein